MKGKSTPSKKGIKNNGDITPEKLNKLQNNYEHNLVYKYTPLDEMKEQGEYNFFAVIYDASFPIKDENDNYTCILKLIDQTTNCLTEKNPEKLNEKILTLIVKVKSDLKENLPMIHQIGDIIRVHKGLYAPQKKRNCYISIEEEKTKNDEKLTSSFCIFSGFKGSNDLKPYLCSNSKYDIESQDKEILESLRNWTKNYFSLKNSLYYPYEIKLSERFTQGSDKDLLVQVVKKVELDDQIVFYIQDSSDGCELHTFKYYDFINENSIIRIRSFKIFDNDILVINEFGNILELPPNSANSQELINELTKKLKDLK